LVTYLFITFTAAAAAAAVPAYMPAAAADEQTVHYR